jgi:hypothetical protein
LDFFTDASDDGCLPERVLVDVEAATTGCTFDFDGSFVAVGLTAAFLLLDACLLRCFEEGDGERLNREIK